MLMKAATVVQVLQDLFLCFIACFILLVIAPLGSAARVGPNCLFGCRGNYRFTLSNCQVTMFAARCRVSRTATFTPVGRYLNLMRSTGLIWYNLGVNWTTAGKCKSSERTTKVSVA